MIIKYFESPQEYEEMLGLQRNLFDNMVDAKRATGDAGEEYLFMLEHTPVITLGRHAHEGNLLFSEDFLKSHGINLYRIERGGDVTYHGPGQLVVYPLIDLEKHHLGIKAYVEKLEEAVIQTLNEYGIKGERVEGATGVWLEKGTLHERKICAIGVKCRRYVTMHGLALNVNNDLSPFSLINPCGFTDKGVTSIARELGHNADLREVAESLCKNLLLQLG